MKNNKYKKQWWLAKTTFIRSLTKNKENK